MIYQLMRFVSQLRFSKLLFQFCQFFGFDHSVLVPIYETADHIPLNFLKAVFHKIYLVHS